MSIKSISVKHSKTFLNVYFNSLGRSEASNKVLYKVASSNICPLRTLEYSFPVRSVVTVLGENICMPKHSQSQNHPWKFSYCVNSLWVCEIQPSHNQQLRSFQLWSCSLYTIEIDRMLNMVFQYFVFYKKQIQVNV